VVRRERKKRGPPENESKERKNSQPYLVALAEPGDGGRGRGQQRRRGPGCVYLGPDGRREARGVGLVVVVVVEEEEEVVGVEKKTFDGRFFVRSNRFAPSHLSLRFVLGEQLREPPEVLRVLEQPADLCEGRSSRRQGQLGHADGGRGRRQRR